MKLTSIRSTALAMFLVACARQEAEAPVPPPSTSNATSATSTANVVEFLSTSLSDYVTGQVIAVDGGVVRGPC